MKENDQILNDSMSRAKTDQSVSLKQLNQSKAASNNYFNRMHKESEPTLLITETQDHRANNFWDD